MAQFRDVLFTTALISKKGIEYQQSPSQLGPQRHASTTARRVKEKDGCISLRSKNIMSRNSRDDDSPATKKKMAMTELKSVQLYKY